MKLWLLRPVGWDGHHWVHRDREHPWGDWSDRVGGFVVRAETERAARELAAEDAGEEQFAVPVHLRVKRIPSPWQDSELTSCIELTPDGPAGVVMLHPQDA